MKKCLLIMFLAQTLAAQNPPPAKPCIAFSPESSSPTNELAKQPLQSAVTLSGDFDFYDARHDGCWNVHVIALPVANKATADAIRNIRLTSPNQAASPVK